MRRDDPAFSPDPRAHPNALSFPSVKSPSPASSPPPPATLPPARQALKPVQTNIPKKSRMKTLVRRLITRHNLDRIDELDETDPFGSSYHHDGPYEAISNNLAQSTLLSTHCNPPPRRNNIPHPNRECVKSDPLPSRPSHYHSAPRAPFAYGGEIGLSLHLEPGQILQQNTIYTSHGPSVTTSPTRVHPEQNPPSKTTRPMRRQSLPIPQTLPPSDPSFLGSQGGFQPNNTFSLRTPRERYIGEYTPDVPNNPPINYDHNSASYVLHQPQKTVLPPPRYESILDDLGPPRSAQPTPTPPFIPIPPKPQSTGGTSSVSPFPGSRHKSVHSLDGFHTAIHRKPTQSSSSTQSKPLDPPRMRHLPKRLVMPAPLKPQAAQPQYEFPLVAPPVWREGHPNHDAVESAHFEGKPARYSQEPRLLRKKSSAFPPKAPIPNIVPMSQDVAVPIMGNPQGKTANESEGIKERIRRRRLSKRKSDI